jgi:hypothetical protein
MLGGITFTGNGGVRNTPTAQDAISYYLSRGGNMDAVNAYFAQNPSKGVLQNDAQQYYMDQGGNQGDINAYFNRRRNPASGFVPPGAGAPYGGTNVPNPMTNAARAGLTDGSDQPTPRETPGLPRTSTGGYRRRLQGRGLGGVG